MADVNSWFGNTMARNYVKQKLAEWLDAAAKNGSITQKDRDVLKRELEGSRRVGKINRVANRMIRKDIMSEPGWAQVRTFVPTVH